MAKRSKFFRQKTLTLAQQLYWMQVLWPSFVSSRTRSEVSWQGQLTPTTLSDTYTVRVTYTAPRRPKIEVITPRLRTLPGKKIPHTFSGNDLCLHLPGQWTADMTIARTIIQWTSLWLFFYEAWLLTGEWRGEGHEPPTGKEK